MCCESCGTNLDASKLHWESNDTKLGCRSSGAKWDASNCVEKVAVSKSQAPLSLNCLILDSKPYHIHISPSYVLLPLPSHPPPTMPDAPPPTYQLSSPSLWPQVLHCFGFSNMPACIIPGNVDIRVSITAATAVNQFKNTAYDNECSVEAHWSNFEPP